MNARPSLRSRLLVPLAIAFALGGAFAVGSSPSPRREPSPEERDGRRASLERYRTEQGLILAERTAVMLGELDGALDTLQQGGGER